MQVEVAPIVIVAVKARELLGSVALLTCYIP
jgi:hypothetical protein